MIRSSPSTLTKTERSHVDGSSETFLALSDSIIPVGVISGARSTFLSIPVRKLDWAVLTFSSNNIKNFSQCATQTFVLLKVKVVGKITGDATCGIDSIRKMSRCSVAFTF